jgi:hypothetical protein
MSRLDSLPPDLSATLALLLRQGKRYAEVAALLGIAEQAVHDRAHAGLALLAPGQARALSAEERERVGEYLLGQQDEQSAAATCAWLESGDGARAWARALESELAGLAAGGLPTVPTRATPDRASLAGSGPSRAVAASTSPSPASETPASPPAQGSPPASRVGGAVVLGGLAVIAVVVVLFVVVGVGGGSSHADGTTDGNTTSQPASSASTPASGSSTTTTGAGGGATSHGKALALVPPDPAASKAVGVAYVLAQKGEHAFYLFAKGLPAAPAGTFYAVWLEGSASKAPYPLGSLPAAGQTGLIEGGGPLPVDAGSYRRIIVTSETSHKPSHPGPTALGGPFTLG